MKSTLTIRIATVLLAVSVSLPAGEELSAPADLEVVQTGYGEGSELVLTWSNTEEYDRLTVLVDDVAVGDDLAGSANRAVIEGIGAGAHTVGVRASVGAHSSDATSVEFAVEATSPVTEPITDLNCQFVAERGGRYFVAWSPGASDWTAGQLSVDGLGVVAEIDAEATEVEVSGVGLEPAEVSLRFRDAAGHFSDPIVPECPLRVPNFVRGDCNDDGQVSITDAIFELDHLFRGGDRWYCDDACDVNDDGDTNLSDPVSILNVLFLGGASGELDLFGNCRPDLTDDFLGGVCSCPG